MKILFVCLGNICRSPMAEGVMKNLIQEHNLDWEVESAGTERYHVGECPDKRAQRTAAKFGLDISKQVAKQISSKDFERFDLIYALATDVMDEILSLKGSSAYQNKIKLFMDELFRANTAMCRIHGMEMKLGLTLFTNLFSKVVKK